MALVSIYLFIFALAYIPLADGIAIGFINPVLVVAMAAVFLREPIGPGRWLAVGVGFGGAMIILRPGLGVVHWAGLLVVVSAAAFSIIQIQTRMLSATDRPVTTFFYISAVGVVLTSIAVPFVWRAPTLEVWLLLALQGGLSGIAQYAFIRAYDYAQASGAGALQLCRDPGCGVAGLPILRRRPGPLDHRRRGHHHGDRPLCVARRRGHARARAREDVKKPFPPRLG